MQASDVRVQPRSRSASLQSEASIPDCDLVQLIAPGFSRPFNTKILEYAS